MKVMKLPDRGDAAERHLEKRHSRSVVNIFRRQARGRAIHHLAPGPKTVFVVCRAVFSASANHALESVRVCVDQSGKQSAVVEANRVFSGRSVGNYARFVADEGDVALETAAAVNQVGQPRVK